MKNKYGIISLKDGRGYVIPLFPREISLKSIGIYNAQSVNAKLFKFLIKAGIKSGLTPFIIKIIKVHDSDLKIFQNIKKILNNDNLEFSISLGTPGPHKKPVLQIMNDTGGIIGYGKIGINKRTIKLVKNESDTLKWIKNNNFSFKTPDLMYEGYCNDNYICIQSPSSYKYTSSPRQLNSMYVKTFHEMAEYNLLNYRVTSTEYCENLYKHHENIENSYYKYIVEKGLEKIINVYGDPEIPFHRNHGDFAPWNALISNNHLFLYDWEYSHEYAPAFYDIFHFIVQTEFLLKKSNPREVLEGIKYQTQSGILTDYLSITKTDKSQIQVFLLLYLLERLSFYASTEPHNFEVLQMLSMLVNYCVLKDTL